MKEEEANGERRLKAGGRAGGRSGERAAAAADAAAVQAPFKEGANTAGDDHRSASARTSCTVQVAFLAQEPPRPHAVGRLETTNSVDAGLLVAPF